MTIEHQALVLHRRTRMSGPASLHCREVELSLGEDGHHVMLSRYVELYSEAGSAWCSVQHHRIPLTRLVRWIISQGERTEV